MSDVLTQLQLSGRGLDNRDSDQKMQQSIQEASVQQEIAALLVSLDYYLGCVLQPQPAASHLLQDAFDALVRARHSLSEPAAGEIVSIPAVDDKHQIDTLLSHMDGIGAALSSYRSARDTDTVQSLRAALNAFDEQANNSSVVPLSRLAAAAKSWFKQSAADSLQGLSAGELALLDEVHAVIPQVIDQLLGGSDDIRGFDELLEQLEQTESAAVSPQGNALSLHDGGSLTLNVDDDLLNDPFDQSLNHTLDNTLQHVFYHECLSHLEALDESVRSALQPGVEVAQRLPTEQMLRALHTLTE